MKLNTKLPANNVVPEPVDHPASGESSPAYLKNLIDQIARRQAAQTVETEVRKRNRQSSSIQQPRARFNQD